MISNEGLTKLGFVPVEDFITLDDGAGPYIKEWRSASPQPSDAEIETAHNEWQAKWDAQ